MGFLRSKGGSSALVVTVLLALVAWAAWPSTAVAGQITASYQVGAGADDGYAWGAAEQDIGGGYLLIGDDKTYAPPYYMSAMRFTNVAIPRSAAILQAQLKISSLSDGIRGKIYGVIQGEVTDDADDFSAGYFGQIAKSTATIVWDH